MRERGLRETGRKIPRPRYAQRCLHPECANSCKRGTCRRRRPQHPTSESFCATLVSSWCTSRGYFRAPVLRSGSIVRPSTGSGDFSALFPFYGIDSTVDITRGEQRQEPVPWAKQELKRVKQP